MTSPSAPIPELLSIVLTTSAVQSNPSTFLTDTVMQSFALADGLTACRKIVICDGMRITDREKSVNWKGGRATQEAYDRYQVYIARLQALAEKGEGQWANTTIIALPHRHGFSLGALEGIKMVTTPYCMVVQHDRAFNQLVKIGTLFKDMNFYHSMWVAYVDELLRECNIADLKWDQSYPPYTFLPTPQSMPPTPTTPARSRYYGSLPIEEQAKAALEITPQWSVGRDEYTLNHLYSGYPVPFPVPYPQPSTGLPLDPQYNDVVVRITEKYREIRSPFENNRDNQSGSGNNDTNHTNHADDERITSSATVCNQFISRVADNSSRYDRSKNNNDDGIESVSMGQSPQGQSNDVLYPGRVHFRKPQYPHPLPIHYVNFVTNQTQSYLSHTGKSLEQLSLGCMPAYHTAKEMPTLIKDPKYLKEVRKMRYHTLYDGVSDGDDDDDDHDGDAKQNKRGRKSNKYVASKHNQNDQKHTNPSSSSSSSSSDSSSDTGPEDNQDGNDNDKEQNDAKSDFQTFEDLIKYSQQHLNHCLPSPLLPPPEDNTQVPPQLASYNFGTRLVPMMYWFDSTHIALTQWYKELYTTEDRGGFPFLRPGDFAEDRYIQFQTALTQYGSFLETQYNKGCFDTPDMWDETRIRNEMGIGADDEGSIDANDIDGGGKDGANTASSGRRPNSELMELANKRYITFPIDKLDKFQWDYAQSMTPFIYGTPPHFRVRDLKQVAYRIARCARVKSFADAHNVSLREMGLWLYEHSSQSYDNLGFNVQDPISHQYTCLSEQFYDFKDDELRDGELLINNFTPKLKHLQNVQHNNIVRVSNLDLLPKRNMICGHALAQVNVQCHGSFNPLPAQCYTGGNNDGGGQNGDFKPVKNNYTNDDTAYVWAVKDLFPAKMTIKHLDGKAYLRYEQKIAKMEHDKK